MEGINLSHLRLHVIRPVLQYIEHWSPAAENLVLGTALVESRAHYLAQLGGPALGLWQMEPATERDIWQNYLAFKPELRVKVEGLLTPLVNLSGNLFYGAAMCRIHYLRVRDPLPAASDAAGMARYWKQFYNTPLGKGTVEKALPHFRAACGS